MSEKRFYLGNNDTTICDRSQGGSDGFNMLTIFKVVDLLNELVKDNEELGISIKLFEDDIATKDKKIDEQQTIIQQKDKQLERLYNYFQDYLKDEMSGNAFSEMWDFVKEDESWEDE